MGRRASRVSRALAAALHRTADTALCAPPPSPAVYCFRAALSFAIPPSKSDDCTRGLSAAAVGSNIVYGEYTATDLSCTLMTAADASAPADAVFRFTAGETMQTSRPTSASGEDDDEDTGSEEYSDDRVSD